MMLLSKRAKQEKMINEQAHKESFLAAPGFYENSLEVSEHFIKLEKEVIPKNYIIGIYVEARSMIDFYFMFITGEWKAVFHMPGKASKEAERTLPILKRCIPNAMLTTTNWLFEWSMMHKKKLAMNYKELEDKYGIPYLIHNFIPIYEQFACDGTMGYECVEGNKVTIVDDTGRQVMGEIAKVKTFHNDKRGCLVELNEDGITGRVIKVHKKPYCLEFKDKQDDSE